MSHVDVSRENGSVDRRRSQVNSDSDWIMAPHRSSASPIVSSDEEVGRAPG